MDGDASGKTMDKGASSALHEQELTGGIHEDSKPRQEPVGEKTTGATSLFSKEGAIGKQFQPEGMIGSVGEAVGGPFSSKGAIGQNFTAEGSIGGAVHEHLGKGESNSISNQK
ncbi:hypothetical protein H2203_002777 [Taxawa tesnikishii (nom. ined.)]|nr:hypothetical protein H2203_002777 [Dothideales sp. JES 119]